MQLSEILNKLQNVRQMNKNSYQCSCPCHTDDKPSMTITEIDEKILIHCHAGCNTWDIVDELGMKMSDLNKKNAEADTWQANFEQYKRKQIEAVYNYTDRYGKYLYSKLRMTGKDIIYGRINGDKTRFNMGINGIEKCRINCQT